MRKLADKGYLQYEKKGQAYLYEPSRPEGEVKHSLLRNILKNVFQDSPVELVETLVRYELSDEEHEEIRHVLKSFEQGRSCSGEEGD